MRHLLVITPLLPPAAGGGGIYTQLLVNGLLDNRSIKFATVLTEKYPGCPNLELLRDGSLQLIRFFPFRAGGVNKTWLSYFLYFLQNIQFLYIPILVKRLGITHLFIHSSFHNYPNLIWLTIYLIGKLMPSVKLVGDVRDPKLPVGRFSELYYYNKIICCSMNIEQYLSRDSNLVRKLVHIPIILDVKKVDERDIKSCKERYGLEAVQYIFNGSGVYKGKGTDLLLETAIHLRNMGQNICLVIAGKKRDWSRCYENAVESGVLKYIGTIPHKDVYCLAAGALMDINLSKVDSMPRASLEALMAGGKVLLPRGVPEFELACPDSVAISDRPDEIARQLVKMINEGEVQAYDMSPHYPDSVLRDYDQMMQALDEKNSRLP